MIQFQQAIQQQDMIMRQQMENIQNEQNQICKIDVYFRNGDNSPIWVQWSLRDKCADIIQKYKNLSKKKSDSEKFIFNAKALHPSLSVEEAGLTNNSNIFVVETKGVRGG